MSSTEASVKILIGEEEEEEESGDEFDFEKFENQNRPEFQIPRIKFSPRSSRTKDDEEKNNTFIALKNASGYIRREIGQRINLRYNPQIIFELDDSINYGMHIEELIQKVKDK